MNNKQYLCMLEKFQQELIKNSIEDFSIINYDRDNLTLAGSFDFSYYHNVEVKFIKVEFICCPVYFNADIFRTASSEEISSLNKITSGYESNGLVICIEDSYAGNKFFIVTQGLEICWKTVYYYQRENLQPGERIADWVNP